MKWDRIGISLLLIFFAYVTVISIINVEVETAILYGSWLILICIVFFEMLRWEK